MHDRRAHRARADIVTLRVAQRAATHLELIAARVHEQEAEDAARRADARTVAAAEAWDAHLARATFAPEFSRALAAELLTYAQAGTMAREHLDHMSDGRNGAEAAWHDSNARCRLADRALTESRHALRRNHDERMLAALADRTVSKWRRT